MLVLVPANLQVQWQFELKTKFNESFAIYNGITVKALQQGSDQNVWGINDSIITSHSFATHTDERMDEIASVDWDVVIVDEAHHARVYKSGSGTTTTRPYRLVRRLADFDAGGRRSLLLLTATPMQLNTTELYYLIELLDPALFPSVDAFEEQLSVLPELNRLVRAVNNYGDEYRVARILQEEGSPTLGKRYPVHEMLARRIEAALDGDSPATGEDGSAGAVGGMTPLNGTLDTAEGRERIAEALRNKHRLSEVLIRNRKRNVGGFKPRQAFNWPVEQTDEERAAYAAVERYVREGYQRALETQNNALGFVMVIFQKLMTSSSRALRTSLRKRRDKLAARTLAYEGSLDLEELEADEEEAAASRVERASAEDGALVSSEELLHLDELISRLERIRVDSKAKVLLERMEGILAEEPQAKVIVFTQFRETQEMLKDLLEEYWPVYLFHGQIGVLEKDRAIARFREDSGPCLLISTEAGGEGRNLQFSHLLVNYDLPWNPMRVEQRIGRVDRIGQEKVVSVFNFSVQGTIEERILDVLERRIGLFKQTVGGLDPILGEVETDLRKIYQMAEHEAKRALDEMERSIEQRVAAARKAESQLADFIMDARSFQPRIAEQIMGQQGLVGRGAMRDFTVALLKDQKTLVKPVRQGVYELVFREPLLSDLRDLIDEGGERRLACFEPSVARDEESVEFFTFGHPIVDALVEKVLAGGYKGMAAVRQPRNSGLPPLEGYQFNYVLEVGGINPRKEVLSLFVDDEGRVDEELGRKLLDLEASFRDERGDDFETALQDLRTLDDAFQAAEDAAAVALEAMNAKLSEQNRENLKREREKLERYFDYRAVVAEDKIEDARAVVRRIEASEDPSVKTILPLWRSNVERAVAVRDGLAADRERRLSELASFSMPQAGYYLLGVARVAVRPSEEVTE